MAKMTTGMRMLAMTKAAGTGGNRMEGNGGMQMGGYGQMGNMPEMRRRRDSRGRYMEGGTSPMARYHPGGTPSYVEGNEMREREREYTDRPHDPHMGGYGGFVWDSMGNAGDQNERRGGDQMMRPGWPQGDGGNVTNMHDYAQKKQHAQEGKQRIGFGQNEEHKKHLTKEDAEEWVEEMKTKDGRPGKRWSYDEIRQYAGNYGISGEQRVIDFFAVVNMMYSDYCHVARKLGVDRMEFYADMAKAFMDDPDAVDGKLVKYWECIVKKDDE